VVEFLPDNCEALNSNPSTTKKKKKRHFGIADSLDYDTGRKVKKL
jgi:hypothetical protein